MIFKFEAMDSTGREIVDAVEADNQTDAEYKIRMMGYFVTKIAKVKPEKDNIKVVYTDSLPHNYWKIAFFALLAAVIVLSFISMARGQEIVAASNNNGLFQEVAIQYEGKDYCFHRTSSDYRFKPLHWGDWEQWPMNKNTEVARIFKPLQVDQREVTKMLGPELVKWLEERAEEVGVSGYYNFTNNPLYDWKKFGGDSYGTYTQTRLKVETIDLSKFRLPILKAEK